VDQRIPRQWVERMLVPERLFREVNKLKTLKEKIPLQTRSCVDTSVPSSITCMEKSISATGALFCIASMALRVCSYVPYETPVETVGGDEEVVVDGPIDMEYIVQEVESTATQREGGGVVAETED